MTEEPGSGEGATSTDGFVTASSQYACQRGTLGMLALNFPKGAVIHGPLSVDLACPCCGEPVVIQGRSHHVDAAGMLVSE